MNVRIIPLEYANLSLASPVQDVRACHGSHSRAAVWGLARRVHCAPQCADVCSLRFFRRRMLDRRLSSPSSPVTSVAATRLVAS